MGNIVIYLHHFGNKRTVCGEYVWEDKVIKICKDEKLNKYYFVLNDPKFFHGNDFMSYMYIEGLKTKTGFWDTYEECLNEIKDFKDYFWDDFDFNNFQKID